ncbi:MAG: hypothetical protein M0P52_17080, partial [Rhodoferax sp.]|nr:hypothetical protein [Rhodoferax sp.]
QKIYADRYFHNLLISKDFPDFQGQPSTHVYETNVLCRFLNTLQSPKSTRKVTQLIDKYSIFQIISSWHGPCLEVSSLNPIELEGEIS